MDNTTRQRMPAKAMQELILNMMAHGARVTSASIATLFNRSPRYASELLLSMSRDGKIALVGRQGGRGGYEYALPPPPSSTPTGKRSVRDGRGMSAYDRDMDKRRAEVRNQKVRRDPMVAALFGEVRP